MGQQIHFLKSNTPQMKPVPPLLPQKQWKTQTHTPLMNSYSNRICQVLKNRKIHGQPETNMCRLDTFWRATAFNVFWKSGYFKDLLIWKSKDGTSLKIKLIYYIYSVPLTTIRHFVTFRSVRKRFYKDK